MKWENEIRKGIIPLRNQGGKFFFFSVKTVSKNISTGATTFAGDTVQQSYDSIV